MTAAETQELELLVDGEPLVPRIDRGGFLTLDRRWTPYIQGEFVVVAPEDPSILDPREVPVLDLTWVQRYGAKLQFTADLTEEWAGLLTSDLTLFYAGDLTSDISNTPGRWYAGPGLPTRLEARVLIRERVNNYDGTYTIRVEGVEARYRDYPYPGHLAVTAAVSTFGTFRAVYAELWRFLPSLTYPSDVLILEPGPDDADLTPIDVRDDTISMAPGQTLFEAMQGFLGDLRLWGSEDGRLLLTRQPSAPPAAITLTDATIVDGAETVSIDDPQWGDGLLIEYEEKSNDPQVWNWVRYYGREPAPGMTKVTKMLHITLPGSSPIYDLNSGFLEEHLGAQLYAPLLARAQRRYRSIPVTAVNRFDVRPDWQVTLTGLPGSPDLVGIVTAVTWQVDDGEMQLTLEGIEEL